MKIISLSQLDKMFTDSRKDILFVDVREPSEFAEGHIPGFINIPLSTIDGHDFENKTVVLSCRSGARAKKAATHLRHLKELLVFEASFLGWKEADKPVLRLPRKCSLPIERQAFLVLGSLVFLSVFLPYGHFLAAFVGLGMLFSGTTGICFLQRAIGKMPWNARG